MNKKISSNTATAAFTLVEMLAVVVVIIILVGLIIGAARYAQLKAAISRTQSEIATIEQAAEEFKSDFGGYPSSLNDLGLALMQGNASVSIVVGSNTTTITKSRPYMPEFTGKDAFGTSWNYRCPGISNGPSFFDLWSYGPNRVGGTISNDMDNITNWKQ